MTWKRFLRDLADRLARARRFGRRTRARPPARPWLEPLERRLVPAQLPPAGTLVYLQTNAADSQLDRGDWYTHNPGSTTSGGSAGGNPDASTRDYLIRIIVPPGWNRSTSIAVDLYSPEMNANAAGKADESDNTPSSPNQLSHWLEGVNGNSGTRTVGDTRFDLIGPDGTTVVQTTTYAPSVAQERWVRFFTITNPTPGATYSLHALSHDDDQNGWILRVGHDNNADPADGLPANADNPDGPPGTNDELGLGITRTSFQHDAADGTSLTLYQYVAPGQAAVHFHNFDMDGNVSVQYVSPSGVTFAGTVSGNAVWNGGDGTNRGAGDVINNPEAGWWKIITSTNAHNQFIQEGQTGIPLYYAQPTTPQLTVTKDDGRTAVLAGDQLTYTITVKNVASGATAGAANNVVVTDALPAGTTFVGAAFGPGVSGTVSGPAVGANGTVTFTNLTFNGLAWLNAGASATFTITVRVSPSVAPGTVIANSARVDYADQLGDPYVSTGSDSPDTVPSAASLSGSVYVDVNNDGTRQVTEPGVSGVGVDLSGTDVNGNAVALHAVADASGNYTFSGLLAGTYAITETQPANYLDGKEKAGGAGGDTSVANQIGSIQLNAGQTAGGYTFGECLAVGGNVFIDANRDGTAQAGDAGKALATVTLTDPSGNVFTTTTDAQGNYTFANLAPGTYTVRLTVPGGYGTSTATTRTVTLPAAGAGAVNFGLTYSTLSGSVFDDANDNGVRDAGEAGVGATVRLTDVNGNPVTDAYGNPVGPVTTDASGNYTFTGLLAGTYRVTETQPGGYLQGTDGAGSFGGSLTGPDVFTVAVPAGQDGTGYNYAELRPAAVAGSAWEDVNGNGVRDAGEPGIDGVTVHLTGTDDHNQAVDLTTTTANGGRYSFGNLRPGTYTLPFGDTANGVTYAFTAPGQDSDANPATGSTPSFTLVAGQSLAGESAGLYRPASVGGTVWLNLNGDAAQGAGEPGLSGVTVRLTQAGPDGVLGTADDVVSTTTTDAAGNYAFANLPPGPVAVRVLTNTLPGGTAANYDPDGTPDSSTTLTLSSGQSATAANFGYVGTGSIGTAVYNDQNGDGVQDAGEPGLPGVTVRLSWAGDDGDLATTGDNAVLTTTTDASGRYSFGNLPEGLFQVAVDPATLASDLSPDAGGPASPFDVTLTAPGQSFGGADFGYVGAASVRGTAFYDVNGDGVQQPGEPGIGGTTVTLTFAGNDGVFGTADDVTYSSATDAAGEYQFVGLPVNGGQTDNYRVSLSGLPASYSVETTDPDGAATPDTAVVTLGPTQGLSGANFGYRGTSSVGNFVWQDLNGNGRQDPGEPGLDGVTVRLLDAGGNVPESTTTANGGQYAFDGLAAGTYGLLFVAPAGDALTISNSPVANAATDSDADPASGRTAPFAVGDGTTDPTRGAGLYQPGSVGGTVWYDVDGDGTQNGTEPGIPGVAVTLLSAGPDGVFGTADDPAAPVAATTTDAAGNYAFTNLAPGHYRVVLDNLPAGLTAGTYDPDGTATANRADFDLSSGASRTGFGFGDRGVGSGGGGLWNDANGNGVRDAGEAGLAGVRLTLTWAGAPGLGARTFAVVTGTDGRYSFTGLPFGDYVVSVDPSTLPAGLTAPTTDFDGVATPNGAHFTLSAGTARLDVLGFGYRSDPTLVVGTPAGPASNGGSSAGAPGTAVVSGPAGGTLLAAPPPSRLVAGGGNRTDEAFGPAVGLLFAERQADGDDLDAALAIALRQAPSASDRLFGSGPGVLAFGTADLDLVPVLLARTSGPGTAGEADDSAFVERAWLSGHVFDDRNNDGRFDDGDTGVPGVTVTLTGTTTRGVPVARTTTTDEKGFYSFPDLLPGTYSVQEGDVPGFLGGDDALGKVNGVPRGLRPRKGRFSQVELPPGAQGRDYDFAELAPAALEGTVRARADGAEAAPQRLAGVTVTLTGTDDRGREVRRETTTERDGGYRFEDLRPGRYAVTADRPEGYDPGESHVGTSGGRSDGALRVGDVSLQAGDRGAAYDFTLRPGSSDDGPSDDTDWSEGADGD
jgi:uncharacterized repeat protein (TIGR01451 family)